jgi:hypothetical protein
MTTRFSLAIAASLALALVATTSEAFAQNQGEPDGSSSRLLVLNGDAAAPAGGVRILRGSAAPPRAAAAPQGYPVLGPGPLQVVAGERFWVFNQETGQLAGCRNRATANVGERELECTFGTFSRYRRTFGDNFRH